MCGRFCDGYAVEFGFFSDDDDYSFLLSLVFFVRCIKNVNVKIVDGMPEVGGL